MPLSSCLAVPRGEDDDIALATRLLSAIDSDRNWQAYRTEMLPAEPTEAALLWSEEEIAELQFDAAIEQARALRERCSPASGLEDGESSALRWALSIVYSRSFALEALGDDSPALRLLAPFFDLVNHEPESPVEYAARYAEWEADGGQGQGPPSPWRLVSPDGADDRAGEGDGAGDKGKTAAEAGHSAGDGESAAGGDLLLALHAERSVVSGEEIRVPYGLETNAELLCTSGFLCADTATASTTEDATEDGSTKSGGASGGSSTTLGNSAEYVPLFADMAELVGVAQAELMLSDAQAHARLAFLSALDASDAPLAARPGPLAMSGHVQSCVRYLYASDDECVEDAAGGFDEGYVESLGHHTVVPRPAGEVAAGAGSEVGAAGEAAVVMLVGEQERGLSLGRIAELDALASGFCGRAAEALLSELPTSDAQDESLLKTAREDMNAGAAIAASDDAAKARRYVLALEYRLGAKRLLRAFADDCAMQSRCCSAWSRDRSEL